MADETRTGDWKDLGDDLLQVVIDPSTTAVSTAFMVGVARFAGRVKEVSYYPKSLITGQDTNTRRGRLFNRKADASGTTAIADLQFNSTVNAAAKIKKVITLDATAANRLVAAGDVLEWASDAVLTGLADPGGLLVVKIERIS